MTDKKVSRPMNFSLLVGKRRYGYLARCGSATDTEARRDIYLEIFLSDRATFPNFVQCKPETYIHKTEILSNL